MTQALMIVTSVKNLPIVFPLIECFWFLLNNFIPVLYPRLFNQF